jgi:hypothetical protein
VLAASLLGLGAPAGAVGDSGLSKLIITNPVPGWQPEPVATLNRVVTYINGLEVDSIVSKGGNARTAVQGWADPANQAHGVVIALVALRYTGFSAAQVTAHTRQGAVAALASLCATGATQSSVQASTIAAVPDSHTLQCTVRGVTAQPLAAGFARSNVLALVLSEQGALTAPQLAAIGTSQYGALPADGVTVAAASSGGGTAATLLELLAGLVVLAAAGFGLWKVLQRANRSAAPPQVRRGVVQRPASLAGGVPSPRSPRPQP